MKLLSAKSSVKRVPPTKESLFWVISSGHEVALGKVLCKESATHKGKLVLLDIFLAIEDQSIEKKLHVEVCLQAFHIFGDFHEILSTEAFECTLSVVDALKHGQQPHPDIVPQNDFHHVRLFIMTLRMWRGTTIGWLHKESAC